MSAENFKKDDQIFAEYKTKHPEVTFAQFYAQGVADLVRNGKSHATLGANLDKHDVWWQAGEKPFAKYCRMHTISKDTKVVDYGCGSLRIGAHFIRYLNPNCYFGLDVISDFYEIGQQLIGEDLLREKAPAFGAISEESVRRAVEFNPDFVYSSAVAYHVHPSDAPAYYANLKRIVHKSGSVLFMDASICDEEFRYRQRSWAWPLDYYLENLDSLDYIRMYKIGDREEFGKKFSVVILEFKCP